MPLNLSEDDRRAVDLFLDRQLPTKPNGNGGHNTAPAFVPPADAALQKRLARVEQLMGVLGELPADEPPTDLVGRTLQFVRASAVVTRGDAPLPTERPGAGGTSQGL